MRLVDLLRSDGAVPGAPDDGGRLVRQDELLLECQLLDITMDVSFRRVGMLVDCRFGLVSDEANTVVLVAREVTDLRMDLEALGPELRLQTILGSSVRQSDAAELRLVTTGTSHLDVVARQVSLYVVDVHGIDDDWPADHSSEDEATWRALEPTWQSTADVLVQSHT